MVVYGVGFTADVVTNIFAFLLIAYCIKVAFEQDDFSIKKYLVIMILALALALSKTVYTPLILLFLLIPLKKFESKRKFVIYFSVLLVSGFGMALLWTKLVGHLYTPYEDYNVAYRKGLDLPECVHMGRQMQHVLHHIFRTIWVFLYSLVKSFDMYYRGFIGTFGWLDTKLPSWIIHFSYLLILFVSVFEKNELKFSRFQKWVLFAGMAGAVALLLLSQHLLWNCVGGKQIITIQGRYFIPAFPLLFLLFGNSRYNKALPVVLIGMIFLLLILLFSTRTIYNRYFVYPDSNTIEIRCDAEKITEDYYFKTSVPNVYLENGNTRSQLYARSGSYSASLFPGRAFGFTYRFFNGKAGDLIDVEVWRLGGSGGIALSGDSGKKFFTASSEVIETDVDGWQKIHHRYILPSNMQGKEVGIFLYNDKSDTAYFDDLSISIVPFE